MITWDCSPDGLEPQFKADIIDLLTSSQYDWHIVYGYRTLDEQEALYKAYQAGGNKAAPAGKSAHNYGLAVDVQLIVNGTPDWNTSHPGWQWLFAGIYAAPRLHSGTGFGDADHIERYDWQEFKDWNHPPDTVI